LPFTDENQPFSFTQASGIPLYVKSCRKPLENGYQKKEEVNQTGAKIGNWGTEEGINQIRQLPTSQYTNDLLIQGYMAF